MWLTMIVTCCGLHWHFMWRQCNYHLHISLGSLLLSHRILLLDPATQISSTPNFIAPCAWFQAACPLRRSHGYQYSPMLHLLLYVEKRKVTTCGKSLKPIQSGPHMLMSLNTPTACIPTPNMVRHGTCRHNYTVKRGLVIGFCGQPLYCNWPHYPTTRFRSPLSHSICAQPFPDRPRPMPCKSAQMGSCPITFLWLWPATDHEPHSRHVATKKLWMSEITPQSRRWGSHMAGINSNHSTHEMKKWSWLNVR